MKAWFLLTVMTTFCLPGFGAPQVNDGTISEVIVYRGQALVTRTITLDQADGDIELLVENLPEQILPDSLYAVSNNGIQVLSVRYRVKESEKDTRAEVKALNEKIEGIQNELYQATRDREFTGDMWGRVCRMWDFSLEGANVSLDRAAFSSETMKDFLTFLNEKNTYYHNENVRLEQLKKDLEKQLAELNRQKDELARQHKQINRQALVYLHVPDKAASHSVSLSYLVNGADWSPQYTLRADPASAKVGIQYNAVVHQASGEHWTNAALALSTAAPTLVASPPELEPMKIGLISGGVRQRYGSGGVQQKVALEVPAMQQQEFYAYTDQTEEFGKLIQSRRDNIAKGVMANDELNFFASNSQMIEFEADKRLVQELKQQAVAIRRAEGVSVVYSLPGKLTLPSKSDQQLVTIAAMDAPAAFVFTAAPLLTDYVYLQADITNTSDTILLPGAADMFRDGQFVGNADMTLATIGQTFTMGFGVDSQIQVTREFRDKKTESFLGNRVDENFYRLAISNYYDKPIALRLFDRLPWTESKDLSIALANISHPLSSDAEYVRLEKDKGILRWDLELAPNTFGEQATIINYAFTLKYDNDLTIRTMP